MTDDIYKDFVVQFRGAIPGSAAERAGMKKGDIIISVNGKPTPDFFSYQEATADRTTFQKMDVLRDGQLIEVTLDWTPKKPSLIEEEPDYEKIIEHMKNAGIIPKDTPTNLKD